MSSKEDNQETGYWIYFIISIFIVPYALYGFFFEKDISSVIPLAVFLMFLFHFKSEKYIKPPLNDNGVTTYTYDLKEVKSWHLSSVFVFGLFTAIMMLFGYLTVYSERDNLFIILYGILGLIGIFKTIEGLRNYLKIKI